MGWGRTREGPQGAQIEPRADPEPLSFREPLLRKAQILS
jgi:hypothetical protein